MIIAILDEHNTAAYYDVIEEVGHNLQALQYEFDRFLSSLEEIIPSDHILRLLKVMVKSYSLIM